MSRRILIVLLVGLNLVLLAALVLIAYTPPAAFAQAAAAPDQQGEYLLVTANAEVANDAIYLLDSGRRQLHVFRTNFPHIQGQPVHVYFFATRDLAQDFGVRGGGK